MFVGVAQLSLQVSESGSLKGKRQVLRKVIERVKARYNVSVAEVADQDLWQRATIALAVIGSDQRHVNEQVEKIIHYIEEMYVAPLVSREVEIVSLGKHLYNAAPERPGELMEALDPEGNAIPLVIPKGDRSMAEAEGMGDWGERFGTDALVAKSVGKNPGDLSPDKRRELARRLRNPREWEDE